MKKNDKGIIQTAVIILAAVLFYLFFRSWQIQGMNAEIAKLRAEKPTVRPEQSNNRNPEKMFPGKAATALFVENLYDAALASGIRRHEVSTVKMGDISLRNNMTKGKPVRNENVIETYSVKVSLEGNYRDTAEYIREVQNIERYKRIVELRMKPEDKVLRTDVTIEIYSTGGQDAAQ